ncbi:MAG: UDP-4-amino-4-deoxy-L-arabinose--oxoglutarate aminotransferase [Chlamydiae bacterium]|nr:UDP-4-amino-4-deoxy-L-arabinose--oxoglutarate aminotransferase [Chlamydiota bacterium]
MKVEQFFPYAKPTILQEDIQGVVDVLNSGWITRGPKVAEFEQAVADYCGAKYAVAFSSGTAALTAACFAAEVGPHDRMITTPNTFVATVAAGLLYKATPVFVDIDRDTGNLNVDQIAQSLTYHPTRGKNVILPVHFSGIPVDIPRLEQTISDRDTIIIEDAAHALGSFYSSGFKVGSCAHSDMTMFSFDPIKHITTGEGGMVTTNKEELCHRLKLFRNNGLERDPQYLEREATPWYYEIRETSGNYHFTDFQAALGLGQLQRLDLMIEKKRELVLAYRERLKELPNIRLFTSKEDDRTAYHLFVVQIDFEAYNKTRAEVMTQLKEKGIGTQVHYIPVYRHHFFTENRGDISEYFPNMEGYYSQALSLPLYYDLTIDDVDHIVKTLNSVLVGE